MLIFHKLILLSELRAFRVLRRINFKSKVCKIYMNNSEYEIGTWVLYWKFI